jgi:hypothetical protein
VNNAAVDFQENSQTVGALNGESGTSLALDFGVQGCAGKREGVTGSFRVNYRF